MASEPMANDPKKITLTEVEREMLARSRQEAEIARKLQRDMEKLERYGGVEIVDGKECEVTIL